MPSIYDVKPAFQSLLRPLVAYLANSGVTANQVTIAAIVLSFLGGFCLLIWPDQPWSLLLIPLILFIRMALNAIDGMLAREFNMKSRLGAVLNEMGDVISDAALYLPFAFVFGISPSVIILIVILSIVSEMAGVVAIQVGSERRYDGPMGKSDRAFVFGLLGLILGAGVLAGVWVNILLWAVAVLIIFTIVNRCRYALDVKQ